MAYQKTATKTLNDIKDIEYFSRKYNARIGESKQYRHHTTVPIYYMDYKTTRYDYDKESYDVPFVEMHLPIESFEHLMQLDTVSNYDKYHVSQALEVFSQHRADERVRSNNPAVQKAWTNYLTLLELART